MIGSFNQEGKAIDRGKKKKVIKNDQNDKK